MGTQDLKGGHDQYQPLLRVAHVSPWDYMLAPVPSEAVKAAVPCILPVLKELH